MINKLKFKIISLTTLIYPTALIYLAILSFNLSASVIQDDTNSDLLKLAQQQQYEHQFNGAINTLNTYLMEHPNDTNALLMRSNTHLILGNYAAAHKDCQKLLLMVSPLTTINCIIRTLRLWKPEELNNFNLTHLYEHHILKQNHLDEEQLELALTLADIFELNNKLNLSRNIYHQLSHQHHTSLYGWIQVVDFHLRQSDFESAENTLSLYLRLNKTTQLPFELGMRELILNKENNAFISSQTLADADRYFKNKALREDNYASIDLALYHFFINNDLASAKTVIHRNWQNQKAAADKSWLIFFDLRSRTRPVASSRLCY